VTVQSERATRSEARLSTSKNRLALSRPAAASTRGKHRDKAGINFASLAARGRLPRRPRNVRTQLYEANVGLPSHLNDESGMYCAVNTGFIHVDLAYDGYCLVLNPSYYNALLRLLLQYLPQIVITY
jgi:hypothetical protein